MICSIQDLPSTQLIISLFLSLAEDDDNLNLIFLLQDFKM